MNLSDADISERAVLGSMLVFANAIPVASAALRSSDFGRPQHREVFEAVLTLWQRGVAPDTRLVAEELKRRSSEVEPALLVELMNEASSSNVGPYCQVVADYGGRHRLGRLGEFLMMKAGDFAIDLDTLVADAQVRLATAQLPSSVDVCDVVTMDEFCGRPDPVATWAVPGLIDVEDRIVIVAPEGMGKTMLFRQIALTAGQGIHPFSFESIPPITTLLVDLENPGRIIKGKSRPMLSQARMKVGAGYDETRTWIWHRPGGIDLRTRAGVAELDAVCAKVRPRLVCLGPLYKSYRAADAKSEHHAALEVASTFDDLRIRHGFALVLEAHAPLKQGGVRDLRPFGTLLWQQWPEVGLKLIPEGEEGTPRFGRQLKVGTWRGSRDERPWPDELHRSTGGWPWEAKWNDGYR